MSENDEDGGGSALREFRAALGKYGGLLFGSEWRFLLLVFVGAVILFSNLMGARGGEYTTIRLHVYHAEQIAAGALVTIYGMFFDAINALHTLGLPRTVGATLWLSACVALVAHQSVLYLSRSLSETYPAAAVRAIALVTLLVNAIWLPFLTRGVYLGQWGPNVYHNATVTTVKVFSIPVFVLVAVLLRRGSVLPAWRRDLMLGSALLAMSLYAKPTLLVAVAPAAVLFACGVKSPWRDRVIALTVLLGPATAILFFQRYLAYGVESSPMYGWWIEIRPFWVWSQWTRNVPASIALTLAFPAAVTWLTRRDRRLDDDLSLAWLMLLVGFGLAALLVEMSPEEGPMRIANWFGPYLLATHLLFVVACATFFRWYGRLAPAARRGWGARLALALLALHVISGIVYIVRLNYVISAFA